MGCEPDFVGIEVVLVITRSHMKNVKKKDNIKLKAMMMMTLSWIRYVDFSAAISKGENTGSEYYWIEASITKLF
jgi:hypothetical protein